MDHEFSIGDMVEIEPGIAGVVVCLPKRGLYSGPHSAADWLPENGGVVIETTNGAFVQLDEIYPHLKIIKHKT